MQAEHETESPEGVMNQKNGQMKRSWNGVRLGLNGKQAQQRVEEREIERERDGMN